MQAHNDRLINLLGMGSPPRPTCPLHPNKTVMRVRENPVTGVTWFSCPGCGFYGDAVALVAAAKGMPEAEAVKLFTAAGDFSDCIVAPYTDAEATAIASARTNQAKVKVYMAGCGMALRQTPDRARFRAGIGYTTAHLIPREMGLLVKGGDVPVCFRVFDTAKLAGTTHIVYPFTYNGDYTCARVQSVNDRTHTLVSNTRPDLGVFMEHFDKVPPVLIVTSDPVAAAVLYGNWVTESTAKAPVVAVQGFPLPDSLAEATSLRLFTTPSAPLKVAFVLQALCHGSDVRVWWCPHGLEQVKAEHMRAAVQAKADTMTDAATWAVRELERMVQTGRAEDAYREIMDAGIDDGVRARLQSLAEVIAPTAREVLTAPTTPQHKRMALANGRVICAGDRTLTVYTGTGEDMLVNAGINISYKLRTYDDKEVYVCDVAPADNNMPSLQARVPADIALSADALQRYLNAPYIDKGISPYITAYTVKDCSYRDVLARLSCGCEVRSEVRSLGIDENHDIHFPDVMIRTTTAATAPQHQVYTLPKPVLDTYAAVSAHDQNYDAYVELLRGCDNLYVAAFTQGLLHVIHSTTNSLRPGLRGQPWMPEHLLFVETESGIWESTFRQLAEMFSGSDYINNISFTDPLASCERFRSLGTLPLLANIPRLRGAQFPKLMTESPVGIIGLADYATASMCGGDLRTTFVTPAYDKPAASGKITQDHMIRLREQFGAFMLRYLENPRYLEQRYGSPASALYKALCSEFDIPVSPVMTKIAHRYLATAGYVGVDALFDMIHAVLNGVGGRRLKVVHDEPPADGSFTERGQLVFVMPDCVLVSHSILSTLNCNKNKQQRFERMALTQELNERNMLLDPIPSRLDVDTNRCWVFDRKTWDMLAVRPPLRIPGFMTPSAIPLKTIA